MAKHHDTSADICDALPELRDEYNTAKDCDIFNLEPELLKRAADEIERLRKVEILHYEETKRSNAFEAECDRLRGLIRDDAQAVRGPSEPLQCLRCGTIDAFGPVSKDTTNG